MNTESTVRLLLAEQTQGGAFSACPSFSQYPYCWLRDATFVAYALDCYGQHSAAERYYLWAAQTIARQEGQIEKLIHLRSRGAPIAEHEFLPTRFSLSGEPLKDNWPNFQLDGYGQWLWGLGQHLKLSGQSTIPSQFQAGVNSTLAYLAAFWNEPCYDCWEEFPFRWHTSTLVSLYGGIKAIGEFIPSQLDLAEQIKTFILEHCVQEGHLVKFVGCPIPDSSLLWSAVPFGLFEVTDPIFLATLEQIESRLLRSGLRRYEFDTYYGGGQWILLSAWLGWVYVRLGRTAEAEQLLEWIETQDEAGLPEQVSQELHAPVYHDYWRKMWGQPAKPLLWSHAMHLIFKQELKKGNP